MNCCDPTGKCTQGEDCAVRKVNQQPLNEYKRTRRVKPWPYDPQIELEDPPVDDTPPPQVGLTKLDWFYAVLFVLAICYFVAESIFGWGP